MSEGADRDRLEAALKHPFSDPTLLTAALTHRSWRNEYLF